MAISEVRQVPEIERERELETEIQRERRERELATEREREMDRVRVGAESEALTMSKKLQPLLLVRWYKDMWAPFRRRYEAPTVAEYGLIRDYLIPYPFEKDDFVEDEEWKNSFDDIPNARQLLIEHLHQIRESKGYDVERFFYFFSPFNPIATSKDECLKEVAMRAANFTINEINATMEMSGKILKLVRLDKSVWLCALPCFLLTLTVEELDVVKADAAADPVEETGANAPCLKTVRAMVFGYNTFHLEEWRFKE